MKSYINEAFLKSYRALPYNVRQQARKAYRLFRDNPYHNSLQFKRIHSTKPVYSARVSLHYRALGVVDNDSIVWFWIGSHDDYDKLISRF